MRVLQNFIENILMIDCLIIVGRCFNMREIFVLKLMSFNGVTLSLMLLTFIVNARWKGW
jgi:hypothetical protein